MYHTNIDCSSPSYFKEKTEKIKDNSIVGVIADTT